MLKQRRKAYSLEIHSHSGIVERLAVPGDPAGINLVNRGELTGFGVLAFTPRGDQSAWMAPSGPPLNVEAVHLQERRSFAPASEATADRVVCRNPISGHSLTYEFADEHFDLWLEGALPGADQVGLDLDVAFMDLRQNDPPEYQFTVQCPYRSEDRSLCYVYLARPRPPGLLITCLTPAAGWRLRYGRSGVAPFPYRLPMHAVLGLQMLARFQSALDPESRPGEPVKFGVRVSFPGSLAEARRTVSRDLSVPLVSAPTLSCEAGGSLPFRVDGAAETAELVAPCGGRTPTPLRRLDDTTSAGEVHLETEGFYRIEVSGASGRRSDLVLHAGRPWLETLQRSLAVLEPRPPGNAECSYWAHAMTLARRWLAPDDRQDALLADALVRIGMQGLPPERLPDVPAAPAEPTAVARGMPGKDGLYLGAPCPRPHVFRGKTFSPWHLFEHERVQDAFAMIQLYLFAAEAYGDEAFYEHAARIAEAHIADNIDAAGRVYRLTNDGQDTHDYTTVIAPLQALVDLARAMERRGDDRAGRMRSTCTRVADYLVHRGLAFPTEGVPPHVRWTEEGSIACTALSLLYAWWHLERRPEWLAAASRVLDYHEAWGIDAPDVRMHGSSYRYWETQWENDGEGRAINAGHPWTLWRAEALYYWALATGDARRLLQSWNGYATNRCKFAPDGTTSSCFTPDYLPDRPRRFALVHSYPAKRDRSIAQYLWPRAADTWLRSAAVLDAPGLGPVVLNGTIERRGDGLYALRAQAPFFDRLFLLTAEIHELSIEAMGPVELLHAPSSWRPTRGERQRGDGFTVAPQGATITLQNGIAP